MIHAALSLVLLFPLALPGAAQEDSAPDRAQVEASVARLQETLTQDSTGDSLAALDAARAVPHPEVIAAIEKLALRHDDPRVKSAAIEALGHMHHAAALKALHKAHKRDKKRLDDDPVLYATLLREIARHGDESSIDILTDNLFAPATRTSFVLAFSGWARFARRRPWMN